jgi:hypothetical protein
MDGIPRSGARQEAGSVVQAVQHLGSRNWHGLPAGQVGACGPGTRAPHGTHPAAWDDGGFPGPACSRGYKNIGVDAREPFDVRDARPAREIRGQLLAAEPEATAERKAGPQAWDYAVRARWRSAPGRRLISRPGGWPGSQRGVQVWPRGRLQAIWR